MVIKVYILLYFLIVFLFYILKDTPLCGAAKKGHTDIVKLLIENAADVNMSDCFFFLNFEGHSTL